MPQSSVATLLAAARTTIDKVPYCWAATTHGNGMSVRPMGHVPHIPGEDDWAIWFLTRGDSRKVADIRGNERTTLVFQETGDDAYVTLSGPVAVIEDRAQVQARWKARYNVHFPTEADREDAVFLRLTADCMELWIRGVTPEPFGVHTTTLKRDAAQQWCLGG